MDREAFFMKANEHKAKAVLARKEKRFWDAFYEDSLYFHEMRLCEVKMHDERVKELKESFKRGLSSKEQYQASIKQADGFLESWSDRERALHTLGNTMKRLKIEAEEQKEIAEQVVGWSKRGGLKISLKLLIDNHRSKE